ATCTEVAARVKCRVRATATKYRSCCSSIWIAYDYRNELRNVLDTSSSVRHRRPRHCRNAPRSDMPILTEDMQRVVGEQALGFWATVCEDGSPNLSPKGTTSVWDDDRLCFAEICSPQTLANIRRGSPVEVNVVDPFLRKGYRFKGPAHIYE